jgi:hypothetical protein
LPYGMSLQLRRGMQANPLDNFHPSDSVVFPGGPLGYLRSFHLPVHGRAVVPWQSGHFVLFFQTLRETRVLSKDRLASRIS